MSDMMAGVSELLTMVERASWRAPHEQIAKDVGHYVKVTPFDTLRPRDFGAALPLNFPGIDGGAIDALGGMLRDTTEDALSDPLDVTTAATDGPGHVLLLRAKRATPSEVRGLIRSPLPKMWLMWQADILNGVIRYSAVDVVGEKDDAAELWFLTTKRLAKRGVARQPADLQQKKNLQVLRCCALAREYCWHVDVGRPDGMRISLDTDAEGARALLRQRDVAPGERRRALVHWVQAHHRKRRTSDDLSWVRAHLRGEDDASWAGIPVRVRPSAYDLRRLEMGVAP